MKRLYGATGLNKRGIETAAKVTMVIQKLIQQHLGDSDTRDFENVVAHTVAFEMTMARVRRMRRGGK